MKIPTKYSDLNPRSRATFGFTITVTGLVLILGLIDLRLVWTATVIINIITIGVILGKTNSPYFLKWSTGASMMPSIPLGLTVSLRKNNTDNVGVGDVVSYKLNRPYINNPDYIHHRIIGKTMDGRYIIKGDGNDGVDRELVYQSEITSKTICYGNQPIYIPFSPFAIIMTFIKLYKKIEGKHSQIIEDNIEYNHEDIQSTLSTNYKNY